MRKNLMEFGRSMVEMLGVLAVIGVLSIVGLQGYKKTMLQMKANDMWDALNKFQADVEALRLLNPNDTRDYVSAPSAEAVAGMWSAPTDESAHFLNRSDLIPSWAEGDPKKFMLLSSIDKDTGKKILAIRHIRIDNLCSTFLPQGQRSGISILYVNDPDANIKYECRIGVSGVQF